jgi:hypothetical protein
VSGCRRIFCSQIVNQVENAASDELAFCGSCGARIPGDSSFCPLCGVDQAQFAATDTEPADPSSGAESTTAEVEPDFAPGRVQRRERLLEAVRKIAHVAELPDGRIDALPEVKRVLEAANDLARLSELEGALDPLDDEVERFSEAGKSIVAVTKMRADDRLILGHGDEGLRLLRVDFRGKEADVPELEAALRPTADESMWMQSTRGGEQESLAFAGEFQFIVGGSEETLEGLKRQLTELSTTRQREEFGLQGEILITFALGVGMRAAWGSGMATLTDQRLLGVIFDDEIQGRPRTKETAWMPPASSPAMSPR